MFSAHPRAVTACAVLGALITTTTLDASILGTHWKQAGPSTWELYAELNPGYRLTNADLGDILIIEPPAGINHGLFVSDGAMSNVTLTIGNSPGIPLRAPIINALLGGQNLNAAWFVFGGVFGTTIDGTTGGTINGVRILSVDITPGSQLGGLGPDSTTPSRVFLFANDGTAGGTTFGVFEIPPIPGCDGDINGDEVVNLDDFNILAVNFGAGPAATHAQGDLNADGFVNLDDFNVLAINFGNACP